MQYTSHVTDVFHYFAYIISAAIIDLPPIWIFCMQRETLGRHGNKHYFVVNPYYFCVLSDNLYPIHSI